MNGQTLAPSSMVTSPMIWAAGSMYAPGWMRGFRPGTSRIMRAAASALDETRAVHQMAPPARSDPISLRVEAELAQDRVVVLAEARRALGEARRRARQLHRVAERLDPPDARIVVLLHHAPAPARADRRAPRARCRWVPAGMPAASHRSSQCARECPIVTSSITRSSSRWFFTRSPTVAKRGSSTRRSSPSSWQKRGHSRLFAAPTVKWPSLARNA